MAFNDIRAGWIVALIAIGLAALGGMVTVSARAGALETRIGAVESRQSNIESKLDAMTAALARIEGRLTEKDRR